MMLNCYADEFVGPDPRSLMDAANEYIYSNTVTVGVELVSSSVVIRNDDEFGYTCLVAITVSYDD